MGAVLGASWCQMDQPSRKQPQPGEAHALRPGLSLHMPVSPGPPARTKAHCSLWGRCQNLLLFLILTCTTGVAAWRQKTLLVSLPGPWPGS